MKKLMLIIFIALPILSFGQIDYDFEITVIDSFQCSNTGQSGVTGLGAAVYNGDIHLAYNFQDSTGTNKLFYSIRTDAGFSSEIVVEDLGVLRYHNFNLSPAIQFDEFGNPHIYALYSYQWGAEQQKVIVYNKIGNDWQSTFLGEYAPYGDIAADPDGSNGLGFTYWAKAGSSSSAIITYASFNGQNWEFQALSDVLFQGTNATTVNYNNKTYVAYGVGHCPDTLITRIYVKDNLGWSLDYEDVNLTPWNCMPFWSTLTLLGKSNSGLALLTGLRKENDNPMYLKNEGQGWESHPFDVDQDPELPLSTLGSPNKLLFDSNNTAYWLNQANGFAPTLNWRTAEGKGDRIGLPKFLSQGTLWLFDFVIKDDYAYIYYHESDCDWQAIGPVTFKEIKIELNQLLPTSINDLNELNFSLDQNRPNPFADQTIIPFSLSQSSNVTLKIYDIMGVEIRTLINEKLPNGFHSKQFSTENLPSGIYFYKLSVDGRTIAKKFQITK